MLSIEEIKEEIINRIDMYDSHELSIQKHQIIKCKNYKELLNYLFAYNEHKDAISYIVSDRLSKQIFNSDILNKWFDEKFLIKNHIYTHGEHKVYGGYKYIFAIATSVIEVSNEAEVFGFQNATINLTQKSSLYANDKCSFIAYDKSNVYVEKFSSCRGVLKDYSFCENFSDNTILDCKDHSYTKCYNSSNVDVYDYATVEAYDHSKVIIFSGTPKITLFNYSFCHSLTANADITSKNFSNVIIEYCHNYKTPCEICGTITAQDNSSVRILNNTKNITVKDNAVIMDYTDSHTHTKDKSVIIWMNKLKTWFNELKPNEKSSFID